MVKKYLVAWCWIVKDKLLLSIPLVLHYLLFSFAHIIVKLFPKKGLNLFMTGIWLRGLAGFIFRRLWPENTPPRVRNGSGSMYSRLRADQRIPGRERSGAITFTRPLSRKHLSRRCDWRGLQKE